jgi:hypothetical protein
MALSLCHEMALVVGPLSPYSVLVNERIKSIQTIRRRR